MFKVLFRALVVASMALAGAQVADAQPVLDDVNFSQLPTCNAAAEGRTFWVKDNSAASGNCAAGGGSKAICTCDGSNWVVQSGSGGSGSNSFETINMPSGTDPVADSGTDTLNITCTAPLVCTGTSGTDTADWTIDSATVSRCARFDGSGMLVAAAGDCANGDTDTDASYPIELDLDNDSVLESTSIGAINDTRDRYGITSEPSANVLLFDWAPVDDRYLSGPPSSPASQDDEFSGSLSGSWTVVSGGSGTVDPHSNASAVEIYDLSTRSGFLLIQVGNDTGDDVLLRQDYTLPDGSLVVAMFYPQLTSGGNAAQCGIGLNDNDTAPTSGNTMEIILDAQAAGVRVLVQSTGATSGNGIADDSTGQVALAITRVDAGANKAYAGWASFNGGVTWAHVDTATHSATLDNLWLFCDTRATHTAGQNDPVTAVDWLRISSTTNLYSISF